MSTRRRLAVSLVAAAAAAGAVPLFVGSGTSGAAPAPAGCPSNSSYDYTIPTPVGPPTAATLAGTGSSNIAYSAIGADGKLYYYESDLTGLGDTPAQVTPLSCFGGQAKDNPGLAIGADGTRAVFVTAASGTIYQRFVTGNYSSLGAFTPVNGAATTNGPAALQTPDGTYHLFVRGTNGALYHGFKQTASLSSWRFEKVGGAIVGSPAAVVDGNSVLVAATGTNGSVYTVRGTSFAWGPFTRLPNQVQGNNPVQIMTNTPPALVVNPVNNRVTVFAANRTVGLFQMTKPIGTNFNGRFWQRIDSALPADARIAASRDIDGNTVVYARFLDRPSGKILTAYTEHFEGTGEFQWSDYLLAPYTCFNCAPYGVDTSIVKGSAKAAAAAKKAPGAGKLSKVNRKVALDK